MTEMDDAVALEGRGLPTAGLATHGSRTPIPPWTVLIVDDDPDYLRDTAAEVASRPCAPDGGTPDVVQVSSFSEALAVLLTRTVDVAVLDVRDEGRAPGSTPDEDRGVHIFEQLKAVRFLPVVFFTAVEGRVEDQDEPPLVQVTSKGRGSEAAADAVAAAFASGLPSVVRALGDHVREVMRQYLWEHVGPRWSSYGDAPREELGYLLVGRLAKSLEDGTPAVLQESLQSAQSQSRKWHPSRMYVLPPMTSEHSTGDIVRGEDGTWYVLLTPACDLVQRKDGRRKAERLLLAEARPLFDVPVFKDWQEADRASRALEGEPEPRGGFSRERKEERKSIQRRANESLGEIKDILRGSRDRYFHLPAFLEIPDLLVDLQRIAAPPSETLGGYALIASLNPPYAQALLSRYLGYIGRIGLDDPDVDWVLGGLRERQASEVDDQN
ncbi:hypothetical protein ACI792_17675 [Blastococcus sp. SYSU DS0669]